MGLVGGRSSGLGAASKAGGGRTNGSSGTSGMNRDGSACAATKASIALGEAGGRGVCEVVRGCGVRGRGGGGDRDMGRW